jgi:hypothetical protein
MSLEQHLIDRPVPIHDLNLLRWKMMYPTHERICHGLQVIVMCLGKAIENDYPGKNARCFNAIRE